MPPTSVGQPPNPIEIGREPLRAQSEPSPLDDNLTRAGEAQRKGLRTVDDCGASGTSLPSRAGERLSVERRDQPLDEALRISRAHRAQIETIRCFLLAVPWRAFSDASQRNHRAGHGHGHIFEVESNRGHPASYTSNDRSIKGETGCSRPALAHPAARRFRCCSRNCVGVRPSSRAKVRASRLPSTKPLSWATASTVSSL